MNFNLKFFYTDGAKPESIPEIEYAKMGRCPKHPDVKISTIMKDKECWRCLSEYKALKENSNEIACLDDTTRSEEKGEKSLGESESGRTCKKKGKREKAYKCHSSNCEKLCHLLLGVQVLLCRGYRPSEVYCTSLSEFETLRNEKRIRDKSLIAISKNSKHFIESYNMMILDCDSAHSFKHSITIKADAGFFSEPKEWTVYLNDAEDYSGMKKIITK